MPPKSLAERTCDKVGLVRGEVEDEGGDLVGGADAAHLLARDEVLQRRVGVGMGLKTKEFVVWIRIYARQKMAH